MFHRQTASNRPRGLLTALATVLVIAACGSTPPAGTPASAPSGNDSSAAAGSPPPSAVGAPTGPVVTKVMGAAGGDLSSADGGVTVTIPAGALGTDTTIGVQPIENTAPGGTGASFALTPTGQVFSVPVKVSFQVTDADLDGTSLDAMGIAFQDDAGRWEWQPTASVDAAARRVSVMTTHFSNWTKVAGIQLRPKAATVKLKGTVTLVAAVCVRPSAGDELSFLSGCVDYAEDDELTPQVPGVRAATWAVNGQVGGDPTTGTIKAGKGSAVFTAPAKKPAGTGGRSMVTVSVVAKLKDRATTSIVSNITITGGDYTVVGTFKDTNSSLACAGAVSPLVQDKVTFSLTQTDNGGFSVEDIVNTKTTAQPVKLPVPVPGLSARLISPPEILTANDGGTSVKGDEITVVLTGPSTIGVCRFSGGGSVDGTGDTHDSGTGIIFDTTKFVGGKQTGSADKPQWTWIITEKQ